MKQAKNPQESFTVSTVLVLPNDTNTLGNLMGGNLLKWIDVNAAVSAHRHCKRQVVTAAVNNVSFENPVRLGDIVTLESKVTRAFNSSLEVMTEVWVEDHRTGNKTKCNEAIYTFVAVDQVGSPIEIPGIEPKTDLEQKRFDSALRRRQLSLVIAKRLKPQDASELKALFED